MIRIVQKRHIRDKTNFLSVEIEITQTFFTLQFDGKTVLQHTFCCYVCSILKSIICSCKLVFLNSLCNVECLQVTIDLAQFLHKNLKLTILGLLLRFEGNGKIPFGKVGIKVCPVGCLSTKLGKIGEKLLLILGLAHINFPL